MSSSSDPPEQPRRLVLCCDGTDNTLTAGVEDTNVLLLVAHLARNPAADRIVYYDPGVGVADAAPPTDPIDWAHRSWARFAGLASGRGVYDNISMGYQFLMRNWRDGRDRIYLFGFSRGAFTARAIAGMVNLFGIIRPEHDALLPTLIHIYFSQPGVQDGLWRRITRWLYGQTQKSTGVAADGPTGGSTPPSDERERLGLQVRELFTSAEGRDAWVHWVGVWDTVESVGLPGPLSRSNPSTATFLDKRLRHARHALSFDEHRWTFLPRLYEEPGDIDDPVTGRTLKQRWFAGVHCDVGGSYDVGEAALSNNTLRWMVDEVAADLDIPPLVPPYARRIRHDATWDTPFWALTGLCLRNMRPKLGNGTIQIIPGPGEDDPAASVWEQRRVIWPLLLALVAGFACLLAAGVCLLPPELRGSRSVLEAAAAIGARLDFAGAQLGSLWGDGLIATDDVPWGDGAAPGWAMFWDLGFVAGYGYLVARVASRAFAWLARGRNPDSTQPAWRVLGMAPLMFIFANVAKDLLTLAAIGTQAAGTTWGATALFWLVGVSALVQFLGFIACLPLVALRAWILLPGVPRRRS
jgi:uncharacterized protein (DUF2235 family)